MEDEEAEQPLSRAGPDAGGEYSDPERTFTADEGEGADIDATLSGAEEEAEYGSDADSESGSHADDERDEDYVPPLALRYVSSIILCYVRIS